MNLSQSLALFAGMSRFNNAPPPCNYLGQSKVFCGAPRLSEAYCVKPTPPSLTARRTPVKTNCRSKGTRRVVWEPRCYICLLAHTREREGCRQSRRGESMEMFDIVYMRRGVYLCAYHTQRIIHFVRLTVCFNVNFWISEPTFHVIVRLTQ